MANVSETGNAVNISNFKKGIDYCESLGGDYTPSNSDLEVPNMTAKWIAAKDLQSLVNTTLANSKGPINDREILFEPLNKLVTSVLNNAKSTKAPAQFKTDLKGLAVAIRGAKNKVAKKNEDGTINPDFVSNSHLSYVMKTDNFEKFVVLLESQSLYAPIESELRTVTLRALLTNLKTANDTIGTIIAPLSNARINRDKELYNLVTGVGAVFGDCKSYIRSKFGAKSPQAVYMNSLKFRKEKLTS